MPNRATAGGDYQHLRERIADAIERGIRQQESGWDACETCLGRVADVVLAGLADAGLTIIGGREAHYQGIDFDAGLYGGYSKTCGNCGEPWPCSSAVEIGSSGGSDV